MQQTLSGVEFPAKKLNPGIGSADSSGERKELCELL